MAAATRPNCNELSAAREDELKLIGVLLLKLA